MKPETSVSEHNIDLVWWSLHMTMSPGVFSSCLFFISSSGFSARESFYLNQFCCAAPLLATHSSARMLTAFVVWRHLKRCMKEHYSCARVGLPLDVTQNSFQMTRYFACNVLHFVSLLMLLLFRVFVFPCEPQKTDGKHFAGYWWASFWVFWLSANQ